MNRALDLQAAAAKAAGLDVAGDPVKPAALDSTCFESRHVSRHFEKRLPAPRAADVPRWRPPSSARVPAVN